MNRFVFALIASCLLIASAFSQGPNEGFVMESEGIQHLVTHPEPVYPPIARAAHVQGSVLLHIDVDEHGVVTKIEVVGGPAMLQAAALESARHWTYRPFEVNGVPRAVRVVASVPFSLGIPSDTEKSDQAVGQAFFPKSTECRNLLAAAKWTEAVAACADAVAIAKKFPDPATRMNEIRGAYQSYGQALAYSGNLPEALVQLHLAVDTAEKSLTPTDAEYASAYLSLAFAEHASRMPVEAEHDYTVAEASYRKAIVNLPDMKKPYSFSLARTLAYHSVLASQTGHEEQAAPMRAEALELNPHALDGMNGVQK